MSERQTTPLSGDEKGLALEIASSIAAHPPYDLGSLLALPLTDPTLAAARDQLVIAVMERTSGRAPGSLRPIHDHVRDDPARLRGVEAVLAAQGLEVNSYHITEHESRLRSVRLLIDTAAGLAAQHYRSFGMSDHPSQVSYGPREGQWSLKGDLRTYGSNVEIAGQFRQFLAQNNPSLGIRTELVADGFSFHMFADTKAEAVALRELLDAFARTRLRPLGS